MKDLLRLLALSLMLALGLGACKQQEVLEETNLSLSANAIELVSEGESRDITIQSNQPNWTYTIAQASDWLSVTQSGDVLTLTALPNSSEELRRATILVRADDAMQRLTITQQGVSPAFSLEAGTTLHFTSQASERSINLAHLGQKVKLEKLDDAATWLSVRQLKSTLYSIHVEAQPDAGSVERSSKLIITVGDTAHEVSVVQEAQRYYMLPLSLSKLNIKAMMSEEEKRGSQLIRVPGGDNLRFYHFAASAHMGSPGYIEYDYAFNEQELYTKASVIYKGAERFLDNDNKLNADFVSFMTSEGYKAIERSDMSEDVSMRIPEEALYYFAKTVEDRRFIAYISRINKEQDVRVELRNERVLDASQPVEQGETFPELPLRVWQEWIGSQGLEKDAKKKKSDAEQWELAQGSEYDSKASRQQSGYFYSFYKTKPTAKAPEVGRGYITLTKGSYWIPGLNLTLDENHKAIHDVEGVLAAYDKTSYVYRLDVDGFRVITPAARKLFSDAGFPWVRRQRDGSDLFRNPQTSLAYVVDTYKDDQSGKTMLRVRLVYVGR